MLRKHVYPYIQDIINELASALQKAGIKPNHLTYLGLVLSFFSAVSYSYGFFFYGAMVLLAAGICDTLDGALARKEKRASSFGAFLDSVIDRYSDFFILSGILIYYMKYQEYGIAVLVLVVMLGSILTSYAKARMECFSVECDTGLIERPERLGLIFVGSFFFLMVPVLWVLAILSHITVFQRIWLAKTKLK